MTLSHGSTLRRFWVAIRLGRRTIGWWPFDPTANFITEDERPDQFAFGFLIGMDDA